MDNCVMLIEFLFVLTITKTTITITTVVVVVVMMMIVITPVHCHTVYRLCLRKNVSNVANIRVTAERKGRRWIFSNKQQEL